MNANIILALGIMWKGMLGIFVVIGILALVVYLLAKAGENPAKEKNGQSGN